MKHSVIGNIGALLLVAGTAFSVPVYAESHAGPGGMMSGSEGMAGGMGTQGAHQMSGLMNDMSGEMKEMSGMMESGNMNPEAMKRMSNQMKEMSGMMNNMSGMMHNGMKMDAGNQHKMGQMRGQMEHMRKDMPASNMHK